MSDAPAIQPVTVVADFDTADDFAKKHTPFIESCSAADGTSAVCVTVGHEVAHPNEPGHFIGWIELEADGVSIARVDLTPVLTDPRVSLAISVPPGTVLRALEHCNLHGTFAFEVTV